MAESTRFEWNSVGMLSSGQQRKYMLMQVLWMLNNYTIHGLGAVNLVNPSLCYKVGRFIPTNLFS